MDAPPTPAFNLNNLLKAQASVASVAVEDGGDSDEDGVDSPVDNLNVTDKARLPPLRIATHIAFCCLRLRGLSSTVHTPIHTKAAPPSPMSDQHNATPLLSVHTMHVLNSTYPA